MAIYESAEGASQMFWEIVLSGTTYTCRWGQLGTRARRLVKQFPSEQAARVAYDRAVKEKVSKGYRLVPGTLETDVRVTATTQPLEASTSSLDTTFFENAVISNPDDDQAVLVLADALQAVGDPWGELIVLQHALKNEKDTGRFVQRKRAADEHAAKNEPVLLGPLHALRHLLTLDWRFGLIHGVRLTQETARATDPEFGELLSMVLSLRPSFAIERVGLGVPRPGSPSPYTAALDVLLQSNRNRVLRSLSLGELVPGKPLTPPVAIGELGGLSKLSSLRRLVLGSARATFRSSALPMLDCLEVRSDATVSFLATVEAGALPALETLVLDHVGPGVDVGGVVSSLARLRHLKVRHSMGVGPLLETLVATRTLAKLETLDVSNGDLADADARFIVAHADQFRHLRVFTLGTQSFSQRGFRDLQTNTSAVVNEPKKYQRPGE